MLIASIDPGKNNFAFCIEKIDDSALKNISYISASFNINGSPTKEFQNLLNEITDNGKIVIFKNTNISSGKSLNNEVFHNLTELLDEYNHLWTECSVILIEQQMNKNKMAIKLAQHCYSYFLFHFGRFKNIIEFPAYHKTQVLGAPKIETYTKAKKLRYKAMSKPERKKWAIDKASEILANRFEFEILSELINSSKKDDISDCILMIQAFKYLHLKKLKNSCNN